MKTYSTKEVLNELCDNTNLSFKLQGSNNRFLKVSKNGFFVIMLNDEERRFDGNVRITDIWTLVQQPVTFMDAIRAFDNGKIIKSVNIEFESIYSRENNDLIDQDNESISAGEILSATWYIEEKEVD